MRGYCQLDPWEQISVKFWSKYKTPHARKGIWNHHLRNGAILSRDELIVVEHFCFVAFFISNNWYAKKNIYAWISVHALESHLAEVYVKGQPYGFPFWKFECKHIRL